MQGTIYSKKKNESFQEGKDHKTRKASAVRMNNVLQIQKSIHLS